MKINFKGAIKTVPGKLFYKKQACYGLTEVKNNKFNILLSQYDNADAAVMVETLLHELFHLYFALLNGIVGRNVSNVKQHKIIDVVIPFFFEQAAKKLRTK